MRRPEFVPAQAASGEGGKEIVLRELQRAERDGVKLLIYVGATWCEPCQVFHAAIEQGRLDKELGNVRFLELDHDRDAALLTDTSCISDMIPLFAVPTQDGRCSGRRSEGGVKGDAAVGYLTPKVKALLSAAP